MPYRVRSYYSNTDPNYLPGYQPNNFNNLINNVGVPALLGLGLGPMWGIAALLARGGQTTNIININTRRNNNGIYY